MAERKTDEKLLVRIRGYHLFACEAHLHASCHKKYLREPGLEGGEDTEDKLKYRELEKAHDQAFGEVCESVSQEIITKQKVINNNVNLN